MNHANHTRRMHAIALPVLSTVHFPTTPAIHATHDMRRLDILPRRETHGRPATCCISFRDVGQGDVVTLYRVVRC